MNPPPASPICPHCNRSTATPFPSGGGVCLLCAGQRALVLDLGLDDSANNSSATTAGNGVAATPGLPARIGPYEIIDEIGRGGMARVLAARQPRLDRLVALKVLAESETRADLAQRFLREAHTVARLRHPNIIALHDSGRADGYIYFAMDYLEGGDLASRWRAARPAPREAARLVRQVALALAYAHRSGVLHRDIKPSNILLQDDEPVLADFGLAALLEPGSDLTQHTAVLGTPHYLAPEAIVGGSAAMTPASDLYALGVVLYEALGGRTPFAGTAPAELARRIRESEPPALRTLAPEVPRDLETICHRCLEREPVRRYANAEALAEDLRRFLAGEPILARPLSPAARFLRWARRRPALAALWFLVLLLAVGSTIAAIRINRERVRADAEAARAEVAARHAADEALRAAAALRQANAVVEFLKEDLLAQASPETQPDPEVKLRTVLDRAAAAAPQRFRNDPDLELALRDMLGLTYYGIGAYQISHDHLVRALELARERRGPEDPETLRIEDQLGFALTGLRRNADAEAIKRRLLALQLQRVGPDHRITLNLQNDIASLLVFQGKLAEAEPIFRDVAARQEKLLGADDPTTINTLSGHAVALTRLGRLAEAKPIAQDVLARAQRALGPNASITLTAMTSLASIHGRLGEMDAAIKLLEEAVPQSKRVLGAYHPNTLNTMNSLSVWYLRSGRTADAEKLLEETLAGRIRVHGPEHAQTLVTQMSIAGLYRQRGRLDDAVRLLTDIVEKRTRLLGESHPDTLRSLDGLASCRGEQGDVAGALELFTRSQALRRQALGEKHPERLESVSNLANAQIRTGAFADAEKLLREALPAFDQTHPGGWPAGQARCQLARALLKLGRPDDAGPLLREGYAVLQKDAARIPAIWRGGVLSDAAASFVEYHTALGQTTEAAEWQAKVKKK